MLSVLDLAEQDTHLHKASYNEYAGPCPGCGGDDRFRVKADRETGVWAFMCRSCYDSQEVLDNGNKRGWGDDYDYLRHYRKMTHNQILAFRAGQEETPAPRQVIAPGYAYESEAWQERTAAAMIDHKARLWSAEGTKALEYIRGRGLTDETLKTAHVGYSEAEGIPRLLFPSINDGRYVAIYRRDLRADCPKNERWKDAPGGTKSELYRADCLKEKKVTILVEAAIDALSIAQECTSMVNVVATGGTGCARTAKALAMLALMPVVYVAFDAEDKGDSNAAWWMERLPNARRLRPLLHDINDMLMDNWDIRTWIGLTINEHKREEAQANSMIAAIMARAPELDATELLSLSESEQKDIYDGLYGAVDCVKCLDVHIEMPEYEVKPGQYEYEGEMYCLDHEPGRAALVEAAEAIAAATFPALQIRGVHHVSEWARIKEQVIAEMREEYARQERDKQKAISQKRRDIEDRKQQRARVSQPALA